MAAPGNIRAQIFSDKVATTVTDALMTFIDSNKIIESNIISIQFVPTSDASASAPWFNAMLVYKQ